MLFQRKEFICLLTFCVWFCSSRLWAQQPDIFLLKLHGTPEALRVLSTKNISLHPAYDNQPMIDTKKSRIIFVSGRDGNTELYAYSLNDSTLTRLTYNQENEYSPLPVPGGKGYSVVKGPEQRLAVYPKDFLHDSTLLLHPDSVAYYQYAQDGTPVLNVLDKERHVLRVSKEPENKYQVLMAQGGRTLKPYNKGMMLVQLSKDSAAENYIVWSDLKEKTARIAALPEGCEDFGIWKDYLFYAQGREVFRRNLLKKNAHWEPAFSLPVKGATRITRMVFSDDFQWAVLAVLVK